MARTTISDTLPYVDSRYELGMLASQRVRDLNGGATPVVENPDGRDNPTVVALREIASGKLDVANVRHEFVQSYKDAPLADAAEQSLEVESTDPELREIDAELENTLLDDSAVVAGTDDDSTPDADDEE